MEMIWFAIVCAMLTVYVILDGFDFGAGILHRFVARTDEERRTVLAAIGPVWDGNEVWLIAAGGVLFMGFPRVYAAAFSGFYMALMIVLWLLILRGIAIESRSHQENPLWREFWDTTFSLSSALLAIVLGTALGNVVRGVPVDSTGYFAVPLFTNFLPGPHPGVFDWYTLLVGAFTLCVLAGHGALFLVWKTVGPVQSRSRVLARKLWLAVLLLWVLATVATVWIQPAVFTNLFARPWSLGFVLLMVAGLGGVLGFLKREQELPAFLLTATNAAADRYALLTGLGWWAIGITLAGGYFFYMFRSFRGKVDTGAAGHGYLMPESGNNGARPARNVPAENGSMSVKTDEIPLA